LFLFCHFQVLPPDACEEEGTENSGDDAQAAASSPASFKNRNRGLAATFYSKMNV
jgi:hypothetical protein